MNKIRSFFIIIFSYFGCLYSANAQNLISSGVVRIKTDIIDSLNYTSQRVLNPIVIEDVNHRITDSLNYDEKSECFRFSNSIRSRAYYPEHSVIYFDGYPASNGRYKIIANDNWYYIDANNDFVEYLSWEKFILKVLFFDITSEHHLYSQPNLDSDILHIDYSDVYFQPLKVEGDWIYVNVIKGEDVSLPIGQGWIRWRNDNQLLLKTLYFDV